MANIILGRQQTRLGGRNISRTLLQGMRRWALWTANEFPIAYTAIGTQPIIFNGNAADAWLIGGTKYGNAWYSDGSYTTAVNLEISNTNNTDYNTQAGSGDVGVNGFVLLKPDSSPVEASYECILGKGGYPSDETALFLHNNAGAWRPRLYHATSGLTFSNLAVNRGQWNAIAFRSQQGGYAARAACNGALDSTSSFGSWPITSTEPIRWLGNGNTSYKYAGSIAAIFWSVGRLLTDAELVALTTNPIPTLYNQTPRRLYFAQAAGGQTGSATYAATLNATASASGEYQRSATAPATLDLTAAASGSFARTATFGATAGFTVVGATVTTQTGDITLPASVAVSALAQFIGKSTVTLAASVDASASAVGEYARSYTVAATAGFAVTGTVVTAGAGELLAPVSAGFSLTAERPLQIAGVTYAASLSASASAAHALQYASVSYAASLGASASATVGTITTTEVSATHAATAGMTASAYKDIWTRVAGTSTTWTNASATSTTWTNV